MQGYYKTLRHILFANNNQNKETVNLFKKYYSNLENLCSKRNVIVRM